MSQIKSRFHQLEEAVGELTEARKKRPEVALRGASRRGRVKPGTIEKHMGDDAEWVTINGVHVLVNKKTREPIIGPDSIVRQRTAGERKGQKNLDKILGGKKHGFKVKAKGSEEDDWDEDEDGYEMDHESGAKVPLEKGVGVGGILFGLAMFIDAAATLAMTATKVVAAKLEGAIRQADDALQSWTID